MRITHGDGSLRWMRVRERPLRGRDGQLSGYVVAISDVDEEVAARAALAERESLLRAATHSPAVATSIAGRDGAFLEVNQAWCDFTERSESEARGLTIWDLLHADDVEEDVRLFAELIAGTRDHYRLEERLVSRSGRTRDAQVTRSSVRGPDGSVRFVLSQLVDVTPEHEARDRLAFRERHDPLTGLHNSASLVELLEGELPAVRQAGEPLAVLFVDLDRFKLVNDSLGYALGDQVLRAVAGRLRTALPPRDHVGRLGGDDFAVILHGLADKDDLDRVASRIRAAVSKSLEVDGHHLVPSVSMGIAWGRPQSTAGSLLSEADAALSRAKAAGRAQWRFFDDSMKSVALERLTLEEEIRHGLDGRQFLVHYQPIVSMADESVTGHEALVRWNHPDRGLLAPGAFLSVAEDSGLIAGIGDAVLAQVVARLAATPRLPGAIAVNVSAVQLRRPEWPAETMSVLRTHGVDPHRLVLEITETAALLLSDEARQGLRALRRAGVGLHVDDFGTGFSSIAVLRELPISGLKLDRSFVAELEPGGGRARSLTSGLAGLAAGLGLVGIAEGVETRDQADTLRGQGWPQAQGYLFARPGPTPLHRLRRSGGG